MPCPWPRNVEKQILQLPVLYTFVHVEVELIDYVAVRSICTKKENDWRIRKNAIWNSKNFETKPIEVGVAFYTDCTYWKV